ncbi:MAG: hypothetical protein GX547_14015, partial [Phycisphaerae bacterium]|nr:hypothetical protein [Phycisphaerae bacterium]
INVILGEARSDADTLRAAEPIKIEPGGFLVARELAGFTNNEGEYETRWFWEIHGAPPDEACCFPDGTCEMLQTFACLMQGGTPMGPGSQCDMLKCPVSVEPGACCYGEADPIQCEVMDVIKCRDEYKGTWHGPGSDCEDLNGNHVADVCEIISTPEQACCFDGECRMMPVEACREEKGEPQGPGSICVGDWDGDGKDETCESKWLQPPDLSRTGIDVRDMQPIALADDFLCTETNAITRIVIWGSWLHDEYPFDPANINVTLKLREDIPDPDGSGPLYSMPGKVLWSRSYRPYEFRVEVYRKDILEGWWDPSRADSYIFPGDTVCWMYTFDVPVTEAFCQQGSPDKPIVYWLDAQATIPDYPGTRVDFGWKTSTKHWNDDAVWQYRTGGLETPFRELRYPKPHPWAGHSVDLAFALQTEPCVGAVGACCRPGGCHLITEADCLMSFPAWWMGPGTNCDDLDGNGVADICEPVVPQACCFRDGSCAMLSPGDCLAARGTPMGVGTTCTPNPCDPLGACCDGIACTVETELSCYLHPHRTQWMGPGTDCSDLDGDGVADACETPFIQACCFLDGSCSMLSPWDCEAARGTPMGTGTDCATIECPVYLGACCYGTHCAITTQASCVAAKPGMWAGPGTDCDDLDGDGIADVCETIVYQACCERDGTCSMRTYDECRELGGQPQGPGSACVGDWDGDRRDETCEAKWIQPPDLARTGIDVNTSLPLMLADDYLCTEKNAITRIYVWGSWYRDQYPEDPGNVYFTLAFHEDVPDPDGDGPGYSMPGRLLWRREFRPHDFHVVPFQEHIEEGFWRNPGQAGTYVFPGDTVCWLYIFDIPATEAFCQQGTPDRPLVYWLSVQATPGPTTVPSREPFFGWKTSTKHWNDNAVHRYDDSTMVSIWKELVYPEGHPWEKKSIDLAFALDAEPCVWTPSEPEEK